MTDDIRARELAFHIIGDHTKPELSTAEKIAIDFATVAIKLAFADVRADEKEQSAKVLEAIAARFTTELPTEALDHVREAGTVLAEVYRRGAAAVRNRVGQ